MKRIYETFEDSEFKRLLKVKKDTSWHNFIMSLAEEEKKPKRDRNANT